MAFPTPPPFLSERTLQPAEWAEQKEAALLRIYSWMQLARTTDNRILDLYRQGLIKGTVTGGQGNEGLIVPLALLAHKADDVVCFSHRGLGGHLIWGGHLCEHLNQYFANADSPTKAREGNIHHGDPANRSFPMISHLGAMLSTVTGAVDSQRRLGHDAVGFTFFGDGSSSTGDIHESLNLASLLSIPVVFVIENNGYAYSTPISEQFAPGTELWKRAAGYQMEGLTIDTTDVEGSSRVLGDAIEKARRTSRPILVEARTFRLRGHAAYDTCDYMKPGEAEAIIAQDPLPKFRSKLVTEGHGAELDQIDSTLTDYVERCIKVSMAIAAPKPAGMADDVYAPSTPIKWKAEPAEPASLNLAQAITAGLDKILAERDESLVLGQDIGTYGGAFKVTDGLLEKYSRSRVLNTPLAESACTGYAIGMAVNGHRPIEEFQFADFSTEAVTQITLNAATMHFRAGAACPLVLRFPCGGGLTLGSFHSQELESFFLSMPGIKGLYPSNSQDAFDAILAAYEDNNPVILFEHKALYRRSKQPVVWNPDYQNVWAPKQLRKGDFATFVTYGEMVHLASRVCDYLAEEYETEFDLFDLRGLAPMKLEAIQASLARTGRLVVLHEGRRTHGFGAEIVAQLTEDNFDKMKAAPLRIGSMDIPVPFAPELEKAFRPNQDNVIEKLITWMG